jgi:hypothetical protein
LGSATESFEINDTSRPGPRWRHADGNVRKLLLKTAIGLTMLSVAAPAIGSDETTERRFVVELEAGPVWQSRNDVQIPNTEDGTRFSLVDVVGKGPRPAARLYLTWNINPRHSLRALAAPLSITETGELSSMTGFEGAVFNPGVPTEATYKFNSWRLTYRYRFYSGSRWAWWIGFTAKIRDAKIELSQEGESAQKTDIGFVPLLYIRGWYRFAERWRLVLDVDALAGGPGRAEDASLKLYADIGRRWSVSVGYRTVEGGADVEEVYNFAWLHYAVVSGLYRF